MSKEKKEHKLLTIIKNDKNLDSDIRMEYLSLARFFIQDFKGNLSKSSIDLDNEYGTMSPDTWQEFLKHSSIKKYLRGFKDELLEQKTDQLLGDTDKATVAVRVKQMLDKKNSKGDNANIVVMRLPQKMRN